MEVHIKTECGFNSILGVEDIPICGIDYMQLLDWSIIFVLILGQFVIYRG